MLSFTFDGLTWGALRVVVSLSRAQNQGIFQHLSLKEDAYGSTLMKSIVSLVRLIRASYSKRYLERDCIHNKACLSNKSSVGISNHMLYDTPLGKHGETTARACLHQEAITRWGRKAISAVSRVLCFLDRFSGLKMMRKRGLSAC